MHTQPMLEDTLKLDSLTCDLLFKETFGNPHNRKVLEYLLEAYFDFPPGSLQNKLAVSYESHLGKTRLFDKSMRGDLIVIVDNNLLVDLEMFSTFTKNSLTKSKQYIMRIYSTQLNRGDDYNQVKKVTQINFVDNVKFEIEEEVITKHYFISKELSDDFELDIARLDLIDKKGYNLSERFKKILKFLRAKSQEEREEIAKGDEILMDVNAWLEEYKSDKGLCEFFDEKRWAKIEGKNEGIVEIAKKMLLETTDLDFISRTTGLSINEIEKLKEEITTEEK